MPKPKAANRRSSADYQPLAVTQATFVSEHGSSHFALRWVNAARKMCSGNFKLDYEDLLQETIEAIWSGRRRWPVDIEWDTFFYMVMLSVCSNLSRPLGAVETPDDLDRVKGSEIEMLQGAAETDIEENFVRVGIVEWLEQAFKDHPQALKFSLARLDGASKQEIMVALGIDETRYNTLYNTCKDRFRAEIKRQQA